MKKKPTKRAAAPSQELSFHAKLRNIARGMDYFALIVPEKITEALGTRAAVPVMAQVNDSERFLGSLYPLGKGRHGLRVRNAICKTIGIKEGDDLRVKVTVRDRAAAISLPQDVKRALRAAGVEKEFTDLPIGKRGFVLRMIEQAVKPETRQKRIREVVEEARSRKGAR